MSNLLPSRVAEGGFTRMLERLGRDCGPTQYVREFVNNGIEAIQRTNKPGLILVDVDWEFYDSNGFFKLSFTDTGDGMTGEEMLRFIKDLSSTGYSNQYENYGLGAKIAAMTRNPGGIIYQSWKDGIGSQIVLRYDEASDAYGCAQLTLGDGQFGHWAPLDDDVKPPEIDDHGTKVTLIGTDIGQDTMRLPEGVSLTAESWIYRTINERFYQIDDDIEIKVRIGYDRPRENTKHNHLLIARGQASVYDSVSEQSGTVQISDAKVHWYILKEGRSGHGRNYVTGNTSVLHQGEVFDRTDGRTNRAALFGILFGAKNVVLVIEPTGEYSQNVQRTALQRGDGKQLSWERWSDEFKDLMPKELEDYVKDLSLKASKESHSDNINDRLKSLAKFYKISRYRPTKDGLHEIDPAVLTPSSSGGIKGGDGTSTGASSGNNPGSIEDLLAINIKSGGIKAKEATPNPFPRVDWVSISQGTRDPGELEDRAALYIQSENLIKANKDFRGYQDVIDHFLNIYKDVDGSQAVVSDIVIEWFEQQLVESVAGILSMRNRKLWSLDDIERALSQESLTACIMQRFHLITQVNRNVRSRLGKPSSE